MTHPKSALFFALALLTPLTATASEPGSRGF
jgi:hypothetical protein